MSILTYIKQMASFFFATPSNTSSFNSVCLCYEWMASSILAGVFGGNQWCLAPAEITGVRGGWAHEFSSAGSVNAFCEVPSTPNILPHVSGTNRLSLFFMGFLVPILFAWPANDSRLPQTYRKWQYRPVLWFHFAQEEALLVDVLSCSIKERLFSSVTPEEAH